MASSEENPLSHVVQHPIVVKDADLGILTQDQQITLFSDHISMIALAGLLLIVCLPLALRRKKTTDPIERMVPRGFGHFIEVVCDFLRKQVAEPSLGKHTDRFIKYVWSLFFFVLAMNLLGMLPIPAVSALFGTHIGGAATGNIWVTGTLATMTFLMMIGNGLRLGGMAYIKHFNPGPWWMAPLLVPIEIFGLFAKSIALAVRLFANMLAGHLVLAVLLSFIISLGADNAVAGSAVAIPVVVASVAISMLEIFVAFLQAFIFTFLTTLFIGMSVNVHHEHEEHDHGHGHGEGHAAPTAAH